MNQEQGESDLDKELKAAIAHILSDDQGIFFFKWLLGECNYQKVSIILDPTSGEIVSNRTIYLESRRNLWLLIRSFITSSKLNAIEILQSKREKALKAKIEKERKNQWAKIQEQIKKSQLPPAEWEQENQ
jgi:hypothetical protein